jgi:hypothetical protein
LGHASDEFLHISLVFGKDLMGIGIVVDVLYALEHLGDGFESFHINFIYMG